MLTDPSLQRCTRCGGFKAPVGYGGYIPGNKCYCSPEASFYTQKPLPEGWDYTPIPNTPIEKVYLWTNKEDMSLDKYIKEKIKEVLRDMVTETYKSILKGDSK